MREKSIALGRAYRRGWYLFAPWKDLKCMDSSTPSAGIMYKLSLVIEDIMLNKIHLQGLYVLVTKRDRIQIDNNSENKGNNFKTDKCYEKTG